MKMQLSEISRALGQMEYPDSWQDIDVTSVQFDSRKVTPGALFVPLQGQRDGHDFIDLAQKSGAVGTLWAKEHEADQPGDVPSILVADPLTALQKLAKYYLAKINPKVVAITGSNGKTTTKDMTAAILASEYNVVKTADNFNNEIGVPVTILGMNANTEILVVEMGMDRPGQLNFLSQMVQPDVTVITMIGEAHIEFFKTRDKIADAKMEITNGLKEDGCFIFNGDEPLLVQRAEGLDVEQKTFGLNSGNDVQGMDIQGDANNTMFKTNLNSKLQIELPVIGEYNVINALAAIAVGERYRISLDKAAQALANFDLTKNRTEWLTGKHQERILSDVYNSNPTAAKMVLDTFANVRTNGRRLVVLGDMLELGDQAEAMHVGLASKLTVARFEEVFLVGPLMKALYTKLLEDKVYNKEQLHWYAAADLDQLSKDLNETVSADDCVLLKASHGIHLETIVGTI